jgi:hypothetical protein
LWGGSSTISKLNDDMEEMISIEDYQSMMESIIGSN